MGLDEYALCVRKLTLPAEWVGNEVALRLSQHEFEAKTAQLRGEYRPRGEIENNFDYKQLIPYVIVFNPNQEILSYKRAGTEKRLHDFNSAGVGGHVNKADNSPAGIFPSLLNGMHRECREELGIICRDFRFLGIINEEKTNVGHVHMGIVFKTTIPPNATVNSEELRNIQFISCGAAQNIKLEFWSSLAIRLLQ